MFSPVIKILVSKLCKMATGKIICISSILCKTLQLSYHELVKFDFEIKEEHQEVMGVDLEKLVKKLKKLSPAIHDLKLHTESNLHQFLLDLGLEMNKYNKCILLTMTTPSPNVWVKIVVYPLSFQVDVGCSQEPFECSDGGLHRLAALLEQARQFLIQKTNYKAQIPEIGNWRFDHCHFNIDGDHMTVAGKEFNITFESAMGQFKRLYTKEMPGGRRVLRLEQILTPKKPLSDMIPQLLKQEVKMI